MSIHQCLQNHIDLIESGYYCVVLCVVIQEISWLFIEKFVSASYYEETGGICTKMGIWNRDSLGKRPTNQPLEWLAGWVWNKKLKSHIILKISKGHILRMQWYSKNAGIIYCYLMVICYGLITELLSRKAICEACLSF